MTQFIVVITPSNTRESRMFYGPYPTLADAEKDAAEWDEAPSCFKSEVFPMELPPECM